MVDGRVLVQLMVDMKSLLGGERLAWLISAYILGYLKKKKEDGGSFLKKCLVSDLDETHMLISTVYTAHRSVLRPVQFSRFF